MEEVVVVDSEDSAGDRSEEAEEGRDGKTQCHPEPDEGCMARRAQHDIVLIDI